MGASKGQPAVLNLLIQCSRAWTFPPWGQWSPSAPLLPTSAGGWAPLRFQRRWASVRSWRWVLEDLDWYPSPVQCYEQPGGGRPLVNDLPQFNLKYLYYRWERYLIGDICAVFIQRRVENGKMEETKRCCLFVKKKVILKPGLFGVFFTPQITFIPWWRTACSWASLLATQPGLLARSATGPTGSDPLRLCNQSEGSSGLLT